MIENMVGLSLEITDDLVADDLVAIVEKPSYSAAFKAARNMARCQMRCLYKRSGMGNRPLGNRPARTRKVNSK